ncbi:MAG TPA: hypothetical protein VHA12_02880 [Candidatus Nanoarchaeia archaeon]|nr:hypothetical protein [Candidatus Nanoarchaeia archaeon]
MKKEKEETKVTLEKKQEKQKLCIGPPDTQKMKGGEAKWEKKKQEK